MLGAHCSNASHAIGQWIAPTGTLFNVVMLGYIGWFILAAGIVVLMRSTKRGRSVREFVTLSAVACAPPVIMCLNEYFHPQDLIAMGLALAGLGCVLRQRWLIAGVLLGLALTSQQFALLIVIPVMFTLPLRANRRLIAGLVVAVACIDVPVLFMTSGRAFKAIVVGTGANTKRATALVLTNLSGSSLYTISRAAPLVLAVAVALWIRRRYGTSATEPIVLLSLVSAALVLRLVFEVNLWGYYFMAVTVILIVRQAIQGRISWGFVLWLSVVTYAALDGGLANRPALAPWPMSLWQAILVPWALALACDPLRALTRGRSSTHLRPMEAL